MSLRLRRSLLALSVFILAGVASAVGGHVTGKLTPAALIFVGVLAVGGLAALCLDHLGGKDGEGELPVTSEGSVFDARGVRRIQIEGDLVVGGSHQTNGPRPAAEDLTWPLIARDWSRVLEIADRRSPKGFSGPLLRLLAAFDSGGVPEILLNTDVVRRFIGGQVAEEAVRQLYGEIISVNCLATPNQLHGALRVVDRLELASHNQADPANSVSMKILVQRAVHEAVGYEEMQRVYLTAADALIEAWPNVNQSSQLIESMRRNAATVIEKAGETLREPSLHPIFFRIGRSLEYGGQVGNALYYWSALRDVYGQRRELVHPDALTIRWELAYCQGQLGETEAAVKGMREVLADFRKISDLGHGNDLSYRTELTLRRYLCWWRGELRDPLGAVKELGKLLDEDEKVLGPEDPETLTVRYNLGRWIGQSGQPAEAIQWLESLQDDCRRILGAEDPLSLAVGHDLAWWYGENGDSGRAVREFEGLLGIRKRILGLDHIHTLATRHDLAWWRWDTGDRGRATTELKKVCADYSSAFTPDHPHTLAAYADLSYLLLGGEHRMTHGQIRDNSGRVHGDLPGLDFLQPNEIQFMRVSGQPST
jgi:hypothetical protein